VGGGTITASAAVTFNDDKPIAFAVTGGTGAYEGARGSGTTRARSASSPLSDTVIHLLPSPDSRGRVPERRKPRLRGAFKDGGYRDRTGDLYAASVALSQLS
jgi:hypothetical protein